MTDGMKNDGRKDGRTEGRKDGWTDGLGGWAKGGHFFNSYFFQ